MKSRKAYSAFSKPAGRGRRRAEWGVQLLNIWRDCLRKASVSGVVQGHQLGSLLFGTTALVFLMPMYANRTLVMAQEETICSRQGRRQSLQTVTGSLKHRIKMVNVCSSFRVLHHVGTKNKACVCPLVTSSQTCIVPKMLTSATLMEILDALLLEVLFDFSTNDSNSLFLELISCLLGVSLGPYLPLFHSFGASSHEAFFFMPEGIMPSLPVLMPKWQLALLLRQDLPKLTLVAGVTRIDFKVFFPYSPIASKFHGIMLL